jgi:DnaK suppressor protein
MGERPLTRPGWLPSLLRLFWFRVNPGAAEGRTRDRSRRSGQEEAGKANMNKAQLKKFKAQLEEKRDEIIKKAKQTLNEEMMLDANDLPDEMDLASSEYLQSFTFRLRGREKFFLDKIQTALAKIEASTFGNCDECEEEISIKRLEARPETNLCIRCKEDQERLEKDYG